MSDHEQLDERNFIHEILDDEERSTHAKYRRLVVGEQSLGAWLRYELTTSLLGWIPGPAGLWLRKTFYPGLLRRCGKNVIFGRNVTLRCAHNVDLGDGVFIDDNVYLDGRGAGAELVKIGCNAIIGRNALLHAKLGPIHIGSHASIGANSMIVSQGGVFLGSWVSLAGGAKVSGGLFEMKPPGDCSRPPFVRYTKGPIRIGECSMIGSGATVLDGVSIGKRCVVGPNSLVAMDIPDDATTSVRPPLVIKN